MQINCPNCGHVCDQNSSPARGPSNDGSEVWVCLKCPAMVCGHPVMQGDNRSNTCYAIHTAAQHPEMYRPHQKPTKGTKKNRKHGR